MFIGMQIKNQKIFFLKTFFMAIILILKNSFLWKDPVHSKLHFYLRNFVQNEVQYCTVLANKFLKKRSILLYLIFMWFCVTKNLGLQFFVKRTKIDLV